MIRYGGVELSAATPAMMDYLRRWWRPECDAYFRPSGASWPSSSMTSAPPVPQTTPPQIGVLHWPSGASRWATYYQIVSGEQLSRITELIVPGTNETLDLEIFDDSGDAWNFPGYRTITTAMHMLPPKRLSNTANPDEDAWLICLVDRRWHWWHPRGGPEALDCNEDETFNNNFADWERLIMGLVGLVDDTLFSFDFSNYIDGAYYGSNWGGDYSSGTKYPLRNRWSQKSTPVPLLIDAACEAVGRRLTRNLDGSIRIWSAWWAAATQLDQWHAAKFSLVHGGYVEAAKICDTLPGSVNVLFDSLTSKPTVVNKTLSEVISSLSSYPYVSPGNYYPATPDADPSISSKTGLTSDEYAPQLYAEIEASQPNMGGLDDSVYLNDYANVAAIDWYSWRLAGRVDATFSGIIEWDHSPAEMAIEWSDGTSSEGPTTRVQAWPAGDFNQYGSRGVNPVTLAQCEFSGIYGGDNYYTSLQNGVPTAIPLRSVKINLPQDVQRQTYLIIAEVDAEVVMSGLTVTVSPDAAYTNSGDCECFLQIGTAKLDTDIDEWPTTGSVGTLPNHLADRRVFRISTTHYHTVGTEITDRSETVGCNYGDVCVTKTFDWLNGAAPRHGYHEDPYTTLVMMQLYATFTSTVEAAGAVLLVRDASLRVIQLDKVTETHGSCGPVGEVDPPPTSPPAGEYDVYMTLDPKASYPGFFTITINDGASDVYSFSTGTPTILPYTVPTFSLPDGNYTVTATYTVGGLTVAATVSPGTFTVAGSSVPTTQSLTL